MATSNPRLLFDKLNLVTKKSLEAAAALTLSRTHYDVEIEHILVKLLDQPNSDIPLLLKHYSIDVGGIRKELDAALGRFKTGNGRAPSLSTNILDLIREAWLIGSIECGAPQVRSGHMFAALLTDPKLKQWISGSSMSFVRVPGETVLRELKDILPKLPSDETTLEQNAVASAPSGGSGGAPTAGGGAPVGSKSPNLDQFTMNLTASAKAGKIDAVVGRDAEIRQVIDILTRRRQNNPILTGEAGVGKTAVVEGLAIRIASGDVPPPLKNVTLRTLDLGLLTAGAGVKGEFENRLKGVIDEVKSSPQPIILFIDEAHTMIGAGGQSGGNDAANLLKPALARGELRTIAATTLAEYKLHFETDAALKRRFQQVKVDEPNEEKSVRMIRGLVGMLEKHHKVRILAEAVNETVKLSTRYMPDRQQPDKSVSLLDTTCARVALSQSATPPALEDVKREVEHLATEIAFLEREGRVSAGNPERLAESKERKNIGEENIARLEEQLKKEQEVVVKIKELREKIEGAAGADKPPETLDADRETLGKLTAELNAIQGETPLIYPVVDGKAVAEVLAGLTGIPMGKMVRNEMQTVLALADRLGERVVGQGHGLDAIAQRIRTSRAELGDPSKPIAVLLLVGPSGVGKTETALALADLLYGGERNMVTINMSEFKNESDVSKLKGTTAGFVGYGQGGVLTNAVRNRPYSVVLLDEFEKAHPGVYELFFQVFDKGTLSDDRSEVNFKNCIIILTANVGTETLMKHCADPETMPSADGLAEILRPELEERFSPALLGRIKVVPFFPLQEQVLKQIIKLKLKKIGNRLGENYKATFTYTPAVVDAVAARCTEVSSGARNVDHILTGTLLPQLASELLGRMAENRPVKAVTVDVNAESQFTYDLA